LGLIEAAILGIVQGLTEFLPISSSGHLVIMQHFLGVKDSGLMFEVLVHFATLLAVIVIYWQDIKGLIEKPFQYYNWLLIVGTIPTAVIGLAFEDLFEKLFSSVEIVGLMLIITGILLLFSEMLSRKKHNMINFKSKHAFLIGFGQGLAITPGISRSGITIAIGLLLGLNRENAARFSFLLSVPVILGATVHKGRGLFNETGVDLQLLPYIVGALFAGVSGYFAIKILLRLLQRKKLYYFSLYCWIVGLSVLMISYF